MGQKANLLTIYSSQKNFNLQTDNPNLFLKGYFFEKALKRLLYKKDILVSKSELNFEGSKILLNLDLYYRSLKTSQYKRKGFSSKPSDNSVIKSLKPLIKSLIFNLKNSSVVLSQSTLNNFLEKPILIFFYSKFKRFAGVLFNRRFSLFIDFLKMTSLFFIGRITTSCYLQVLGQIFKILPKRKHARFLVFLKALFTTLVEGSAGFDNNIGGIKLIISGKLKGKPRSSITTISVGSVPVQSVDQNVDFTKMHVYTLLGTFGFKIWVLRK
jgi:hypothetical protein